MSVKYSSMTHSIDEMDATQEKQNLPQDSSSFGDAAFGDDRQAKNLFEKSLICAPDAATEIQKR